MDRIKPRRYCLLLALGLSVAWVRGAGATSFVAIGTEDLARDAAAIVVGTVVSIESAAQDGEPIHSYIAIDPEQVVKGDLPLSPFVIKEPGGTVGDRVEWVYGVPEFSVGERVLLFLKEGPDGTLHTAHLSLGKFAIGAGAGGEATVRQDLGYGAVVYRPVQGHLVPAAEPPAHRLGQFLDAVTAAAQGAAPDTYGEPVLLPAELWVDMPREYHDSFTYLGSPSRWFEPDSGLSVDFKIDQTGDAKLGLASSRAAMNNGFAGWTDVPASGLILGDGGLIPPTTFAGCTDGNGNYINKIMFNDPFNEIDDPSNCGGILGIGGYCGGYGTKVINGTTFNRIVAGRITFNNGWQNCSAWNECNVSEVATHELGHAIGFGHSTASDAIMRASAYFNGRCNRLGSDDIAAAEFVYPLVGTPVPTPTYTATRTVTPTASRTPTVTKTPVVPTVTPTPNGGPVNLALGQPATQSSLAFNAPASRAVDGVTDGSWYSSSVTHTNSDLNAWWQVDLGAVASIGTVSVWNRTDCCSARLSNFYVFVSDAPFTSTNLNTTLSQPGVSSYYVAGTAGSPTDVAVNRTGRYVRVQLSSTDYLSLAEVEVWQGSGGVPPTATVTVPPSVPPTATRTPTGVPPPPTRTPTLVVATATPTAGGAPVNLALGKSATQSSLAFNAGPQRAVDGVTDGNWTSGSVTHTNSESQAWWEVDLGAVASIGSVDVWNRTDCCGSRLSAFYVLVSDVPFVSTSLSAALGQAGVSGFYVQGPAGTPTTVAVNRSGRYVRVQLSGSNYLSLAEVEVWGGGGGGPPPATATQTPTPTATATLTSPPAGNVNLALGQAATQATTAFNAPPERAVDGDTNGDWYGASITHTHLRAESWWQVDLGGVQAVASIDIWNRTDCCSSRLSNFYVFVSDTPFVSTSVAATLGQAGVSSYYVGSMPGVSVSVAVNRSGRYVRVQLTAENYLSLAEVQVWGTAAGSAASQRGGVRRPRVERRPRLLPPAQPRQPRVRRLDAVH